MDATEAVIIEQKKPLSPQLNFKTVPCTGVRRIVLTKIKIDFVRSGTIKYFQKVS